MAEGFVCACEGGSISIAHVVKKPGERKCVCGGVSIALS